MSSTEDKPAPWAVELYEGVLDRPSVSYHSITLLQVDDEVVKMKTTEGETISRTRASVCKLLLVRTT